MVKDFLNVYKGSIEESVKVIKNKFWIILLPLIGAFFYGLIVRLLGRTGILSNNLSGYLIRFIYSLILSQIFFQFERAINRNSITAYRFQDGFIVYLIDIYLARFLFFIIDILASIFIFDGRVILIISLVIYFLLNPIGEKIYLGGFRTLGDLNELVNFIRENWYLWLPHGLVYLLYKILIFNTWNIDLLEMYIVDLPILSLNNLPIYLILGIIQGIYLIFRGVMYKKLSTSTRRKREYLGRY